MISALLFTAAFATANAVAFGDSCELASDCTATCTTCSTGKKSERTCIYANAGTICNGGVCDGGANCVSVPEPTGPCATASDGAACDTDSDGTNDGACFGGQCVSNFCVSLPDCGACSVCDPSANLNAGGCVNRADGSTCDGTGTCNAGVCETGGCTGECCGASDASVCNSGAGLCLSGTCYDNFCSSLPDCGTCSVCDPFANSNAGQCTVVDDGTPCATGICSSGSCVAAPVCFPAGTRVSTCVASGCCGDSCSCHPKNGKCSCQAAGATEATLSGAASTTTSAVAADSSSDAGSVKTAGWVAVMFVVGLVMFCLGGCTGALGGRVFWARPAAGRTVDEEFTPVVKPAFPHAHQAPANAPFGRASTTDASDLAGLPPRHLASPTPTGE